jgi:hypothetical protein
MTYSNVPKAFLCALCVSAVKMFIDEHQASRFAAKWAAIET